MQTIAHMKSKLNKMKCELNKNIELTEDGDNIPSDIYLGA